MSFSTSDWGPLMNIGLGLITEDNPNATVEDLVREEVSVPTAQPLPTTYNRPQQHPTSSSQPEVTSGKAVPQSVAEATKEKEDRDTQYVIIALGAVTLAAIFFMRPRGK